MDLEANKRNALATIAEISTHLPFIQSRILAGQEVDNDTLRDLRGAAAYVADAVCRIADNQRG